MYRRKLLAVASVKCDRALQSPIDTASPAADIRSGGIVGSEMSSSKSYADVTAVKRPGCGCWCCCGRRRQSSSSSSLAISTTAESGNKCEICCGGLRALLVGVISREEGKLEGGSSVTMPREKRRLGLLLRIPFLALVVWVVMFPKGSEDTGSSEYRVYERTFVRLSGKRSLARTSASTSSSSSVLGTMRRFTPGCNKSTFK